MQRQAVLLVALVGALLVAGSAAGAIRPVQETKESEYVFVKLLFDGHDQPNFDRWHSNATAATVAQAAGVPVHYLIRLVDGKIPGTEKAAPPPKKQAPELKKEPEPATEPVHTPITTTTTPAPSVTLITNSQPKPQEPEHQAVATVPESAEGTITTTVTPTTTTTPAPAQPRQQESLWSRLTGARRIDPTSTPPANAELEPTQVPVSDAPQRPRFFVFSGRKLLGTTQVAPNQALVEYAIKTNASEPWAVRDIVKRKLMASAAGFGMAQGTSLKGFYSLLKEHGVGYYPAMWVDNEQILAGEVAMQAPPNRFINGTKDPKNFQHKLYKHTDLVKPKAAANATNVTVAEPAFIMANRSTTTETTTKLSAAPSRSGLPAWASALIALGTIAIVAALAATVWRVVRDRRARQAEEEAAHSEPLSPHSVVSTSHPA